MTSTEIAHSDMVRILKKSPQTILDEMTPSKMDCLHMASKACSETGELMDAVGKWCYYNKALHLQNVIEELGDLEFYMAGIRQQLGIERDQTLQANMDKLAERYKGYQYSDAQAQARADKAGEAARQ